MVQVTVLNKNTTPIIKDSESIIKLDQVSTVKLEVAPDQIRKIERVGNNAVITLKNGEVITLDGFYDVAGSKIILQQGASVWEVGGLEAANAGEIVASYLPVSSTAEVAGAEVAGSVDWLSIAAGVAGVGAVVAITQHDHNNKDTTAPAAGKLEFSALNDQGISAKDHLTNDNNFGLALIDHEIGANIVYQVSTDGGKTWVDTTVAQKDLADGSYQYRAVVTDAAGNQSVSTVQTIIIDKTAPVAGTLSLSNFEDTGSSDTDGISQDKTFDLKLTGQEAGASVVYQVSSDGGKTWVGTTITQKDLADGSYQYRAVVTDAAGNQSVSSVETVTIDTVSPVTGSLSLSSFEDTGSSTTDRVSQDKNFNLALTGEEAGTNVQYQRSTDGGKTWVNTTAVQTNLADGSYLYRAVVTDAAGNSLVSNVQEITIDTQLNTSAISLTINPVTEDNIITLVESITQHVITGSLTGLSADLAQYTLTVLVNGHSYAAVVNSGTGQWTATVEGSDLFAATQIDAKLQLTDKAGNQAELESIKSYTVNAVPDAPVEVLITTNSMDGTIVSGSAFAGSVINVKDSNGNIMATTITNADGTFVIDLPMLLSDGEVLSVTATVNEQESQVVASTVNEVPAVYIRSIDAEGVVNGVATPGSVISIVDNQGNLLQEFQVPQTISILSQLGISEPSVPFTFTLNKPLAEGEQVSVEVSKKGIEGRAESFVADYTAPATVTDVLINEDGSLITGHVTDTDTYISIVDANGYQVGFGEVDEQGNFAAELYQPLHDGQTVSVVVIDFNNNQSSAIDVVAPDYAPIPDIDRISAEGLITGHAEANSQITLTDANGQILATGLTNSQGFFNIESGKTFVDGQQVFVSALNTKAQQSAPGEIIVDLIVPDVPTDITINEQGTIITGHAEPNSQVKISVNGGWFDNSNGYTNADGYFSVLLNRPLHDGQSINVSVLDDNGNISPVVTITAPEYAFPASVSPVGLDSLLNGSAEAGSTIIVKDAEGNEIATGQVYSNDGWWFPFDTGYGSFNIQLPNTVTDGQQLSIFVVDSKGNVSEPTITTVDHVAPTAPVSVDLADDGTTLTGEAEPYASIRVLDTDGQIVGSGQVNSSGQFEFKLYSYFLKGETLAVVTIDQAGNTSTSLAIVAPVDTTPPAAATELSIDQYGRVLTGVAEANSFVEVKNAAGNVVASTTVEANGTFTVSFYGAYVRGETLTVQVTDRADNQSLSTTIVAPTDTTAPAVPTDLVINATNGQLLTGKAEAYSRIVIKDADGNEVGNSYANETGVFSAYLYNVYLKGQTLTVVAVDAAGNESSSATLTAPVDNSAPLAATDLAVSADGSYLSGVAEIGATIKVLDATGNQVSTGYSVVESGDGSFNLNLYNNIYLHGEVLTVVVIDRAGNTSPAVKVTAPVDNSAPLAATDLAVSADGSYLSGVAEAGSTIKVVNAAGNELYTSSTLVNADGTFNIHFQANIFLKGEVLTVQVIDRAGNTSPAVTVTAPLDDIAPLAATDLLISVDGSQLSGVAEAGATIKVLNAAGNEIYTGDTIVNTDGTFNISFYFNDVYVKGEVLTVQVVDRAGNTSPSVTVTAPIDNTAPLAATDLVISADGSYLSGIAEAGSLIKVVNAEGNQVNYSGDTVYSDGTFNTSLNGIFLSGQELTVTIVDRAGNAAPSTVIVAPLDNIAPAAATNVVFDETGYLTGQAELGATVVVKTADGQLVGSTTVSSAEGFTVYSNFSMQQGQEVFVTVIDRAGNESSAITTTVPLDPNAPPTATNLVVSEDGAYLSGQTTPNTYVHIYNENGESINTSNWVDSTGLFNIPLYGNYLNGEILKIYVSDSSSHYSLASTVTAPLDNIAPVAPTAINVTGSDDHISGSAEANSTIIVTDTDGVQLGQTTTNESGVFDFVIGGYLLKGQQILVTATDAAGNKSEAGIYTVPVSLAAPAAATNIAIQEDGHTLTGKAAANTTITVHDVQGFSVGFAQTDSSGTFTVVFNNYYVQGETLRVVVHKDGNNSAAVSTVAPIDTTIPDAATTLVVTDDGHAITGSAEANAEIRVLNSDNDWVGQGSSDAEGHFTVGLNDYFLQGQTLSVVVVDHAGNQSTAAQVVAPIDNIAPITPTEVAFSSNGRFISGLAEAGTHIVVKDSQGNEISFWNNFVDSSGAFNVELSTPLLHGEQVSLVAVDNANNQSEIITLIAPIDNTAPAIPSHIWFSQDGWYFGGVAEPESKVIVKDADGNVLNVWDIVAGADSQFETHLGFTLTLGQQIFVSAIDLAGNTSEAVAVVYESDTTAPDAATNLIVSDDGTFLSGTAEPLTSITILSADNNYISSGSTNADGTFNISLNGYYLKQETLFVKVTDRSGNESATTAVTAPLDNTAPLAATDLVISADGSQLSGVAEAGAIIKVLNTAGNEIYTGNQVVNADGTFNTSFYWDIFLKGEVLTVQVIDHAGNTSPTVTVTAPLDNTAPLAATDLQVSADGLYLSGVAEAGATIRVLDAAGNQINYSYDTVYSDATFNTSLNGIFLKGQQLTVVIIDRAGNESLATTVTAPLDNIAPLAATDLQVSADGSYLTGVAEVGATIRVLDAAGNQINYLYDTVYSDATFNATLNGIFLKGQELTIIIVDRAGNESPAVTVTAPLDNVAPLAATNLAFNAHGELIGDIEAGATVVVKTAEGQQITSAIVYGADGFTVYDNFSLQQGQELFVTVIDRAGNVSDATSIAVPVDPNAPASPTNLLVSEDGAYLTGQATAGTNIYIFTSENYPISTYNVVDSTGTFNIPLYGDYLHGETLKVYAVNSTGEYSLATEVIAPLDNVAPDPVANLSISDDGTWLTGTAEAITTVIVYNQNSEVVGEGSANSAGVVSISLWGQYVNGETLSVVAIDRAGNVSALASVTAPDTSSTTSVASSMAAFDTINDGLELAVVDSSASTGSILNLADQAGLVFVANTGDQPISSVQLDSLLVDSTNSGGVVIQIHSFGDQLSISSADNSSLYSTAAVSTSVDSSSLASVPLSANSVDLLLNPTQLYL